jgi:Family of unknown function (DUF6011)
MTEAASKDIHQCECGKVVAWLTSPTGQPQPYEIKRDISTEPDGTRTVIVSTEDIHHCEQYSGLADFVRNAIDQSGAQKIRIRLPAAEPVVLSWSRGETELDVSNGRAGENLQSYGSINLKTGGYRVRRQSSSLKDLLDQIDHNPSDYDWSVGGSQSNCCFCSRLLSDPRSVRWGYGPTCAEKYGLPWG